MIVYESAVYTSCDSRCVFRDQFRMSRIGGVVERDAVLSIRRALTRNHENLAVGGCHDVVYQPRIDFDRIGEFRMSRIGDVVDDETIGNRRVISIVADDPLLGALKLLERHTAY